jgi:hypothetical protein
VLAPIFPSWKATGDPRWVEAIALWHALVAPRTPSTQMAANRQSAGHTSNLPMTAIGTFETCRLRRAMSEFEGKAENMCSY